MAETQKKWEELGISNDFLFGKVMQNMELCQELLQIILPGLVIDRVEFSQAQKGIENDQEAHGVRLDIYTRDGGGNAYTMEMQATDSDCLEKRSRYYASMVDLQLLDKGELYKKLNDNYVIFICPFDLFGKGRHIYTFENVCKEDHSILLKDGTVKIFLNAKSQMDDVSPDLRAFLDYVAGKLSDNRFVKKLDGAVKEAKQNREWRREYMTLMMRDLENVEKGRNEGRQEGRQEGRHEERQDNVSKMYQKGLSVEQIADFLDLPISLVSGIVK